MQSGNSGDWNAYSKYSVGWITPEVILPDSLESGESVEVTIGALATTGEAIVIPGADSDYNGTPFCEYIIIDLFTDLGVNAVDAAANGLGSALGIRISHVNGTMEARDVDIDGLVPEGETEETLYPIGTINKTNSYNEKGSYLLEVIQRGGDNTFTDLANLRTQLSKDDLFLAGDVFKVEEYTEFFHNGLMDDRTEFGYTIEIVEITEGEEPTATIRITRQ